MTVTLDAPAQLGLISHGPIYRVACDTEGCPSRLYLVAADELLASVRADAEFGWRCASRHAHHCRTCRSPR